MFCWREKWGESQKAKEGVGVGEGKEGNAYRQTPGFWKPPFASEVQYLWSTHVNNVQQAEPITRFSKSRGLSASVSFLPLPHPPLSLFGSAPIFRMGKTPKIPFLSLSLLLNPTETLATQAKWPPTYSKTKEFDKSSMDNKSLNAWMPKNCKWHGFLIPPNYIRKCRVSSHLAPKLISP